MRRPFYGVLETGVAEVLNLEIKSMEQKRMRELERAICFVTKIITYD